MGTCCLAVARYGRRQAVDGAGTRRLLVTAATSIRFYGNLVV